MRFTNPSRMHTACRVNLLIVTTVTSLRIFQLMVKRIIGITGN